MPRLKPSPTCSFCPNPATTTVGIRPACEACAPVARQVVRDKLQAVIAWARDVKVGKESMVQQGANQESPMR